MNRGSTEQGKHGTGEAGDFVAQIRRLKSFCDEIGIEVLWVKEEYGFGDCLKFRY